MLSPFARGHLFVSIGWTNLAILTVFEVLKNSVNEKLCLSGDIKMNSLKLRNRQQWEGSYLKRHSLVVLVSFKESPRYLTQFYSRRQSK